MNKTELHTRINEAVSAFWETKQKQLSSSGDSSNRGAVTAGKQLDGFISMLKDIAIQQGVPEERIYVSQAYLPGYFRSSKDWDFLIVTPKKKLAVAIELKSPVKNYEPFSLFGRNSTPLHILTDTGTCARNLFSKDIIQQPLLSAQKVPGITQRCPTTRP